MRTCKLLYALVGCILFGLGAWGYLSLTGQGAYLLHPLCRDHQVYVAIAAVGCGLAAVVASVLIAALIALARRLARRTRQLT